METLSLKRQLLEQIGFFLEYPLDDFREDLKNTAKQVDFYSKQSSGHLNEFLSKMKRLDLAMLQEYYVQSFDLMPPCSLYLSVHLFGEESFKRAELMAGLKKVYEKNGIREMTELPDHIAVVLKQNALFNDEEWSELVVMCIVPALLIMIKKLEKNSNPYVFILKSVQELLSGAEKTHV